MATLEAAMRTVVTALLACAITATASAPAALASPHRGRCRPADPHGPSCLIWTGKVTFVADGDTVDVAIDGVGKRRIRLTGINTTELRHYSHNPSQRRGECHGVAATAQLERMVKQSHWRVRLLAQHASSHSGHRLRRMLQVRMGGRWQEANAVQVRTGLALWLPNGAESAWNTEYSTLAQQAAARSIGLYDTSSCGRGPSEGARLRVHVKWDADGSDHQNVNGEWIEIRNLDPTRAVGVGRWRVKDSDLKQYVLPSWATIPANGSIFVHVGRGHSHGNDFFWGFRHPLFEDATGDGGYLFDPQGDLRAWEIYPCRVGCANPLAGRVRMSAQPGGTRESARISNISGAAFDLDGYVLALPFHQYEFGPGSTVGPGETMVVDVQGNPRNDTRLHRYYGYGRPMLADSGERVRLQTYNDIVVACTAWGSGRC
jgi:endonuclease YncB( thermonuclease family)